MWTSTRHLAKLGWIVAGCALAASGAYAVEMLVQNDSLVGGTGGNIQAGFAAGESAASWLTSPCDGNIVAAQVFWRSSTGTELPSIEDSIKIFEAGVFPSPGTELASIDGPLMTDSVINEFRFLDENMTIPLIVPVTNGQEFVLSFKFLNAPNPAAGPSAVTDLIGCQTTKNTIDADGFGWVSSCLLGVSGDWVIRAVVDCGGAAGGPGSVPNGADIPGQPLILGLAGGQLVLTWSNSCSASDNDYAVYEGFMGAYYSHFSKFCTTGGATTASFPPDNFNRYFLVVPTDGSREGSYGRDGFDFQRPQGGGACHGLQAITCP